MVGVTAGELFPRVAGRKPACPRSPSYSSSLLLNLATLLVNPDCCILCLTLLLISFLVAILVPANLLFSPQTQITTTFRSSPRLPATRPSRPRRPRRELEVKHSSPTPLSALGTFARDRHEPEPKPQSKHGSPARQRHGTAGYCTESRQPSKRSDEGERAASAGPIGEVQPVKEAILRT